MNIHSVKSAVRGLLQNLDRCGISNREQSIALRELADELHRDRSPSNVQREFLFVFGCASAVGFAIVFLMLIMILAPVLI